MRAMDEGQIVRRTAQGQQEIELRQRRLQPQLRALLIMVNGRSTLRQLRQKIEAFPGADGHLQKLLNDGLICLESAGSAAPVAAPAAPLPASAFTPPVSSRRRSLALARLYLVDVMERMLGARSDAVRGRLRTATTRETLLAVFSDCREIIAETAGDERVRRVEHEFFDLLPEELPENV